MTIKRISSSYIHSLDSSASFGKQQNKYNNISAGIGTPQFLLTNGTWTKPANVEYVDIVLVGGGGGGGSGNYGGGGGGGVVTYIKKFYVGATTTWYYQVGFGGDGGGESSGVGIGDTNAYGEAGGPTMFGTNSSISSFVYSNLNPINDPTYLVSPGGGGGGPNANFGYFAGTGGGSGSGIGAGSWGRLSNDEFWTSGHGYNGGAGASGASGGGGSCVAVGGNASLNIGGAGAPGVNLTAPIPETFVNSAGTTLSCIFGGGGGGSGLTGDRDGGIGGGGTGKNVNGTPNTGGGGSGNSGNGGSGVIIIWEHTQ
jgi:hypothetical protein